MDNDYRIRLSAAADRDDLALLYRSAFPGEDLLPLALELSQGIHGELSLVSCRNETVSGHIVFTPCGFAGDPLQAALLGPLAVLPDCQGQGIGSALVRDGLERLARDGISRVFVLGDPGYYQRLGFVAESVVAPPYPLPPEWHGAWQSRSEPESKDSPSGPLVVPPIWRNPSLWLP